MKNRAPISALLFDLGNVFIRVHALDAIHELAKTASISEKRIHAYFTTSDTMQFYETGRLTNQEFYQEVTKYLKLSISERQFRKLWQSMFSPIDPMIEFLKRVRHRYPCYILSNTNDWHIEYCEREYPFMQWFNRRFYSHELGLRKPDPAVFDRVIKAIGQPADHILFVDDRTENIRSAEKLDLQIIHFTDPPRFLETWKNDYRTSLI